MSNQLARHYLLTLLIIAMIAIGFGSLYCYWLVQVNKCINNNIDTQLHKREVADLIKKRSGLSISIDSIIIGNSSPYFDGDTIVDFSVPAQGISGQAVGNGCGIREIF